MKTNLFKSIAVAALFTLAGTALMAQNVSTPTAGATAMDNTTSDYVTIGSRVPYYVPTDPTIQAMTTAGTMLQSIFNWTVTTNADIAISGASILNYAGTAAASYNNFRVATSGTGFYDNEISVLWDATNYTAGTEYKVKTLERSVISSTIAGCDGASVERPVYVLAHPTVAFDGTEGGGCSVAPGSTYYVPLSVTGLGNWTVTYTVAYNGGAASTATTFTLPAAALTGVTDGTVVTTSTTAALQAGTPTGGTAGLAIVLPASQYGYYDVAISDINDVISKKAMTGSSLTASPATGTFRIYVSPAPTTQPIQHLKNL